MRIRQQVATINWMTNRELLDALEDDLYDTRRATSQALLPLGPSIPFDEWPEEPTDEEPTDG